MEQSCELELPGDTRLRSRLWEARLKLDGREAQPRFSSRRILTQRKIISSPPLKSMPSWTMSPSLTAYGLLSVLGGLSRMWLRKVPDELLTSLMYHFEFSNQNSQWRRDTTLLLNPTGDALGMRSELDAVPWPSRSE
jgi:hypothetical protein